MHHLFKINYNLLAFLSLAICFSGCSNDDSVDGASVSIQNNGTLGDFLVDGNGKTLYFYTRDVDGQSQCTGGCLADWPVYYAPNLKPGDGVSADDFGSITRSDGEKQTTFKGLPLYYFKADGSRGDTKGEAVDNVWFVAKTSYSIMLANAQLVGNDGKSYMSNYQEGPGETQFFVDSVGRTIYYFTKDYKDTNKFTASDLNNNGTWPIFYTEIEDLPSTLNKSDFDEISVYGHDQLTYKGHPLYHFGGDAKAGDTKGVSVAAPGIWRVANSETLTAPDQPTVLLKNDQTLGNVLTDNQGRTLYFFSHDTKGTPTCTGDCNLTWPLFNVDQLILPNGGLLVAGDFGTIGEGASKQLTYKGRPLYHFSPTHDGIIEAAGQTGGENFANFWYVAKPDYSLMIGFGQLVGLDGKNYTSAYVEGNGATRYFTDADGRTIYLFTHDSNNHNTFTAPDLSNNNLWPIFHVAINHLPTGMSAADFGEITVGGESQLTYKGWPLYYFGQDNSKGDAKGVSVITPGTWRVTNGDTGPAPQ
jgi:predicted lipoprotein with Yx(FWY)xxD motif